MQLKRGNQNPSKAKEKKVVEYEIKNYGGNANRNRSPPTKYGKGSPKVDIDGDSPRGEMAYIEPNEVEIKNYQMRSPIRMVETKEKKLKNRDTVERENNKKEYGQYQKSVIDSRREKLKRSPKTINLGETAQEVEYNIKSINRPRGNKNEKDQNKNDKDGSVIERTYNMISNEAGNIFLDQPIQKSFINQQEVIDKGSFDSKDMKEIQYTMNPRDFHETNSGIFSKMSPKANLDGEDSESISDKNDNIKNLRSQLEIRRENKLGTRDGVTKTKKNEYEKGKIKVNNAKENNTTEEEVKKLVKLYLKSYDPKKDDEGRLISGKQTVLPSLKDELFNDRYKVLQKMNKLSNILLSKKNSQNAYEVSTLNRSFGEGRSFDKTTLNKTNIGGKKATLNRGRHNKFLFISLAMLSAKNPEDRTIFRKMRLDKGGVVDLAQEKTKKKQKFKIKKFKAGSRGQNMINPKYKDKAARIVQGWWREQKAKYKNILNQIIKIQSVWRGKFTRKYVYDIIYLSYLHQRFFDIMERTLVNHIRPMVFDDLFSRTKLAKNTLKNLLVKKDTKFTMLRIKPYFRRWRIIGTFLKNRITKSKKLVIKKEDVIKKKKILKVYIEKWKTKTSIYKYIGKSKKSEQKRHKILGAIEMLNGLKPHTKKVAFNQISDKIKKHLKEKLKKQLLTKIVKNNGSKSLYMKMKNILNQWKFINRKLNHKDLKVKIFLQIVGHLDSRFDRMKLKYYLYKWRRHVPIGKRILDIQEGTNLLNHFTLRRALLHPLSALTKKVEDKDEHNKLATLFVIKRRKIRDKLRDYFNKWNENTIKIHHKDRRNDIYNTLLKNLLKSIERRILYKRFNQWRRRPKIDIYYEFHKIREFTDTLNKILKSRVRPEKYDFFDKLDMTRADRALIHAGKVLYKNYKKKSRRLLRHYFYKWRGQTKSSEIMELQTQLLKYLFVSKEARLNRLILAKYLARWRLFVSDKNHYDNIVKLGQVYKGVNILQNIKSRFQRDFIIRLYRKLGNDYRPIILDKLTKKLEKPRSTLRECLEKWRRINEKEKALETIASMKARFLYTGKTKINERNKRDILMKAFFRWKIICRKPDEYYPRITRGFDLMSKYTKKQLCDDSFGLIRIHRSFDRILKKIIKNYENQEKRLLNGKLRNLFGRWRKKINDKNIKDLKGNFLFKTKMNLEKNQRIKTLAKYFTRWKIYRRKGLSANFVRAINLITNLYRRPCYENVLEAYLTKVDRISKLEGANELVKATNRYVKSLLRDGLFKMIKGVIKIDPNRMIKIKTRLRRIIKKNEEEPKERAFHRWRKKVHLMRFKDKDMAKAKKVFINTLRNNDKKNLYYAMNRWKKKIQQIREQYLKSLIVKQIKSTQNVKKQMNNQAKLRAALLKWRAALAPVNYLDRLKHIKKGCKVFKRGLKKRDEREIFDGIYNLARKNKKKYLLKKIINEINPHLDKYRLKECIKLWRNKLGDTSKMKNKIKILFDDYLYSDNIHENLIAQPVDDILELMNNYTKKKAKMAKKINKFAKGILFAKDNMNKLKLTLLLRKLLDKKDKDIDYIKRVNFRKYHRNVQKIKNKVNARIIQRFIKVKLRKYLDKRKLIAKGLDEFTKYIKKTYFNNIKEKAKDNFIKKFVMHSLKRKEDDENKVLLNAMKKWRSQVHSIQENEAALKLQNLFRNKKSRKKLHNLEKREDKLINICKRYDIKSSQILHSYLREWLNKAVMLKNRSNARIIQRYIRSVKLLHKLKLAQLKLKELFRKDTVFNLCKVMNRSSRIIGGKGEVLYKSIQDILYKNPFDKFMNNLKLKARTNTIENLLPKIRESLKNYYVPLALQKWKKNTYDQTVKNTKDIQNFLRKQYKKRVKKDKKKRMELLKKFIERKHKNNMYRLQLPFSIWHKKTILAQASESANIIQDNFRAYITRKHTLETIAKNKLKKLFRINQIKNLLSKVKDAGNKKILNKSRRNKLNKIMKKKSYIDDKSALKRYFDRWRQYNKYTHNCTTKLANAFRTYKANKEKNRLKRINQLLNKMVLKHTKVDNNQMRSKLKKWLKKAKLIEYNISSRRLQRYIRPKVARLLNKKFKKYFVENAKKKVSNLLLIAGKFNKIKKSLERPSLRRFSNNIKLITKKNKENEKLNRVVKRTIKKTKKMSLRKYFIRWRNQNKKIKHYSKKSATKVQNAFRAYMARKNIKKKLFIKNVLKKNIIKKTKMNNNQIYSFFKRWLNTVRSITLNKNATIIQNFCSSLFHNLKKKKELAKNLKIKNGFKKLLSIKFGVGYALDKIKSRSNETIFRGFNDILKKKRAKILKSVFKKIKSRAFKNKLRNALKVPQKFHARILKKVISKWKENAKKISYKKGAELLQKNTRIHLFKKKQENRKNILKHILLKLSKKYSNIKYKYFTKFHSQAMKMSKEIQKEKIARYFEERFRISKARKNWINLSKKCSLRNRNDDIFTVINKIKKFIAINKMEEPLIHKARLSVVKFFKDKIRKNKIVGILERVLPDVNDQNCHDLRKAYFKKWKSKVQKLKERENKLKEGLEIIEVKDYNEILSKINNIMLVKKLFSDIPKIRAKLFLSKIKKIQINKSKYEKLKKGIKKAKIDLINQNKEKFLDKIYKIFACHKINSMFTVLNNHLMKKSKPHFSKLLIKKLYNNRSEKMKYNYGNQYKSVNKARITKLNFNKKIIPNRASDIEEHKDAPIKKCLPHFIRFLERKINYRKIYVLEKLQENMRRKKFATFLENYKNKTIIKSKRAAVDILHRNAKYSSTRPYYQIKLFKLFRKRFIQELYYSLEEPAKIYHLYYLVNVTYMHKKISNQRFFREFIRKWRFAAFAKKMAKKKLELMYKNLHSSYLQMADEFFGEDSINPSVIKEFEIFGNNVGMFTAETPQVGEELNKKYYANVEKKYIFANGQEEEKVDKVKKSIKKKVVKKEKVKKVVKEENDEDSEEERIVKSDKKEKKKKKEKKEKKEKEEKSKKEKEEKIEKVKKEKSKKLKKDTIFEEDDEENSEYFEQKENWKKDPFSKYKKKI